MREVGAVAERRLRLRPLPCCPQCRTEIHQRSRVLEAIHATREDLDRRPEARDAFLTARSEPAHALRRPSRNGGGEPVGERRLFVEPTADLRAIAEPKGTLDH